jgi:hypothetical protein
MDIADAVMLFYMSNYSKRQWEAMADKVNRAMQPGKKRHGGGFVPNVSRGAYPCSRAWSYVHADDQCRRSLDLEVHAMIPVVIHFLHTPHFQYSLSCRQGAPSLIIPPNSHLRS